jgi:hypothetical protein
VKVGIALASDSGGLTGIDCASGATGETDGGLLAAGDGLAAGTAAAGDADGLVFVFVTVLELPGLTAAPLFWPGAQLVQLKLVLTGQEMLSACATEETAARATKPPTTDFQADMGTSCLPAGHSPSWRAHSQVQSLEKRLSDAGSPAFRRIRSGC